MSSMDWRGRIAVLEAERDTLRAEVKRLDAGWREANIQTLRNGLSAENAEAALRELHWLGQNWPRLYWVVGPLWTNAKRYEAAIEALKALRDTAPREEKP